MGGQAACPCGGPVHSYPAEAATARRGGPLNIPPEEAGTLPSTRGGKAR